MVEETVRIDELKAFEVLRSLSEEHCWWILYFPQMSHVPLSFCSSTLVDFSPFSQCDYVVSCSP